jgi:hypothetical protein
MCSAEIAPRGGARSVRLAGADLWLGRSGALRYGVAPGCAVAVRGDGEDGSHVHNLAALRVLGEVTADEVVFVGRHRSHLRLGSLATSGTSDLGGAAGPLVGRVWARMVATLPPLPWREVIVVRGQGRWPRAFAVPGAVVLNPAIDLDRPATTLLYLAHELVHQWLGGLVRRPGDATTHELMEATVEAVAWFLVEAEIPQAEAAYRDLFGRYRGIDGLARRAELVVGLRDGLGARLPDDLIAQLGGALLPGRRAVYHPLPMSVMRET